MSGQRYRLGYRAVAAVAAVAGLSLAASACGSSGSPSASGGGKVTISVDCAWTAANNPVQHKEWLADVAAFEKANPNITIKSVYNYPCEVPATFSAMLRAGTEPDVFHTYFTDLSQVLVAGQAADITPYVNSGTVPTLKDIVPGRDEGGDRRQDDLWPAHLQLHPGPDLQQDAVPEGRPRPESAAHDLGRGRETDAAKIAKLGHGIYGYGDYSAGNTGGWHFSSYMDAMGGTMVNRSTSPATAAFNNATGVAVLEALHKMRFTDHAMSPTQGLSWGSLQQQMAQNKLGMYIAAPDDIYNVIGPTDKGKISDFGMGPLPSASGTPAGSLGGGDAYMFAKHDTPAQIRAGIKWARVREPDAR